MTTCIVEPVALRQIEDIRAYIAKDDRAAADDVVARIRAVVDFLTEYPLAGRKTLERGVRTLVVRPWSYVVFYRYATRKDEVRIIRVRHGAMRRAGLADDASEFRVAVS